MSKIYEKDRLYEILHPVVNRLIKNSYSRYQVCGLEKLPEDGAVIIAPNHCNTLMDALVVLCSRRERTVFGARADIFNNKTVGKLMTFFKILPMVRKRDGLRNVAKNRDSFDQVIETLENGVKFCVFCEGRHRPMHSLLPVNKGIIRIALEANGKFGDRKPVYIVPSGIEYGDYFRFKTTALLRHGEPINVSEYVREHAGENEADIYRGLMTLLHQRISELITYIPDDEKYAPRWTLTRILAKREGSLEQRLLNNREAVDRIMGADEGLLERASRFEGKRLRAKVSFKSFGHNHPGLRLIGRSIAALLFLPVFLFAAIASLPMWSIALGVTSGMKDKAFRNTGRFGVYLVTFPIMVAVWAALFFALLKWFIALPLFLLACVSHGTYYCGIEFFRVLASDFRLAFNRDLASEYDSLKTEADRTL